MLIILALLVVVPPVLQAGDPRLRVGMYQNAPKLFLDETGTPRGIFPEILEAIARHEGWELVYVDGTWNEGLERLARGEIDLMPDVAYSAEREERFAFHGEPVLSDWFQVYARDDAGVSSIVDLAGRRVAVLDSSVQQQAFAAMAESFAFSVTLLPMPDYDAIFDVVARGGADAAITNRFYGVYHAEDSGLVDTAIIFNPTRLFFAAPREGRDALLDRIDFRLREMKADPDSTYYHTLRKWTGEEGRFSLPGWVIYAAGVLLFLLLLLMAGAVILKRQVDLRTRELRQINREMEERIALRTRELEHSMEKAQESDRVKSAFLATMSHELRTPLNSIIGFAGILLQELAGPLNGEQKKQLTMLRSSARHLLDLVRDILDISKIEAGELDLSRDHFDLVDALEKVTALVAPLAERGGLKLELFIHDDPGMMTGDRRRVEQILLNLLNNGVKFTERGGVSLHCRRDGERVILTVFDTGIGIDADKLPGLFQPFHQIDSGLARKREGTGLGLSISGRLAEIMGGTIEVESTPGEGSKFTVILPLFPQEEDEL